MNGPEHITHCVQSNESLKNAFSRLQLGEKRKYMVAKHYIAYTYVGNDIHTQKYVEYTMPTAQYISNC